MKVSITLRYLSEIPVKITREEQISPGCTAGELAESVILAEEKNKNIVFSGASIVTLVNGRVVTADHILEDGDEITVMPVAAAG